MILTTPRCDAAVALNALGQFLATHGYGGAQLVHVGNFFRVPINSNGNVGDLIVDTGAPHSLIFRASVKRLGLTETKTKEFIGGAFGKGREYFGVATIQSLTMGNCTLLNLPVAVAPGDSENGMFRQYGSSDGLLGLSEMVKYGAVLDLANRLLFVRPSGPSKAVAIATDSILVRQGYTAVDLKIAGAHLSVPADVNGWPCHLLVDTGAFLTSIDRDAASKAHIGGSRTEWVAEGIGKSSGRVMAATFPTLRLGGYEIRNVSAAVVAFDREMLGRGTDNEMAGLLGAEYLSLNSAVFDFNSGTLYLKPKTTR